MGNMMSQKEYDETYKLNANDGIVDIWHKGEVINGKEEFPQSKEPTFSKVKDDGTAKTSPHYNQSEIQPIEAMQANMSPERFLGLLQGSALKYLMRMGHKDSEIKDANKGKQYATWLVEALEGKIIDPRK